jgi:glycoprotein 2-beta-D-xylosyltransferase
MPNFQIILFLKCKVNVVDGPFAHMTMKEQLRAILEASVVIGGSRGWSKHTWFQQLLIQRFLRLSAACTGSHIFALISHWKSLEYHAINLPGSFARITDVISELRKLLEGLGC